jgi:hypothetical protein
MIKQHSVTLESFRALSTLPFIPECFHTPRIYIISIFVHSSFIVIMSQVKIKLVLIQFRLRMILPEFKSQYTIIYIVEKSLSKSKFLYLQYCMVKIFQVKL